MDFSYMNASQTASLVLGVIFSIVSVATTILGFKYANKLNSFGKSIAMTLCAPFLAMVSWFFLILSFLDGFRKDEVLNIIISILISLFLVGVIIVVAKALYNKNKPVLEEEYTENTDDAIETTAEEATVAPTLLIANNEKVENKEGKTSKTKSNEPVVEEYSEEDENPVVNDEVKEEEEKAEEPAQDEVSNDEEDKESDSEEENADEVDDETEDDSNEDDSNEEEDEADDDDDFDDAEFEAFLEKLKQRRNAESNDDDSTDANN